MNPSDSCVLSKFNFLAFFLAGKDLLRRFFDELYTLFCDIAESVLLKETLRRGVCEPDEKLREKAEPSECGVTEPDAEPEPMCIGTYGDGVTKTFGFADASSGGAMLENAAATCSFTTWAIAVTAVLKAIGSIPIEEFCIVK